MCDIAAFFRVFLTLWDVTDFFRDMVTNYPDKSYYRRTEDGGKCCFRIKSYIGYDRFRGFYTLY